MAKELIYAGLDLGSDQVKCVVAVEHSDGQVDIIGTGSHPAQGLSHGAVCDAELLQASIAAAVEEASLMAGCSIRDLFLTVSTRHLESFNSDGMVRLKGDSVAAEDVRGVIRMARAVKLPAEMSVLHVVPQAYVLDQQPVERPLGIDGVRLEVDAHVVLGHMTSIRALEVCCRKAKLRIVDVVHPSLAAAEILLSQTEKDLGVVLIDLGADVTTLAVIAHGELVHTATFSVGSEAITLDLKDTLQTPSVEAEHLKQSHGEVAGDIDPTEEVEVPGVGGRRAHPIKRAFLCEIIEARAEELLGMVAEELNRAGYGALLPGGVVLAGGGAALKGIDRLAERILGLPTVVGEPKSVEGLVDVVRSPRYTAATGLVMWGVRHRSGRCYSAWGKIGRPSLLKRWTSRKES